MMLHGEKDSGKEERKKKTGKIADLVKRKNEERSLRTTKLGAKE